MPAPVLGSSGAWAGRTLAWAAPWLAFLAVLLLAWTHAQHPPSSGLGDYYPLFRGARALASTGDAYALDPSLPDLGALSRAGNAYPLHAVLVLGTPLAWLPPVAASTAWIALLGLAWISAIRWSGQTWAWLLWWPMWEALRLGQPTVAVAVAAIVAVGALRREKPAAFVAALVVLSFKPNQSIVLLIGLAWMGRRWWRWVLTTALLTLTVTLVVQPTWPARWLAQLSTYASVQEVGGTLAPALVAVALWLASRGWRESSLAVASNALGMWPVAAHYNAAIWPLGLSGRACVAASVTAALGFVTALVAPIPGGFATTLMASMVLAAWAFPNTRLECATLPSAPDEEDHRSIASP